MDVASKEGIGTMKDNRKRLWKWLTFAPWRGAEQRLGRIRSEAV
jgi:hypothetical protein